MNGLQVQSRYYPCYLFSLTEVLDDERSRGNADRIRWTERTAPAFAYCGCAHPSDHRGRDHIFGCGSDAIGTANQL
jgi:hypothetical protein